MTVMVDHQGDGGLSRRHVAVRLGAGGVAALLLTASTARKATAAQDASPAASPPPIEGVSAALLGSGETAFAPGMLLALRRITLAPGAEVPAHRHPGTHIIVLEAGTFGFTSLSDGAQLHRAGTGSAPAGTPTPPAIMPNGTEVILHPGDWIFAEEPQDAIRNAGEDDVVFLVATVTPVGEPFTTLS